MSLKPKRKRKTDTHNPKTGIEYTPHLFYGQAYVQLKKGVTPMTKEEVAILLSKKCTKTMKGALYDVHEIPDFFVLEVHSERYTRTLKSEVLRVFPNATVRLATLNEKYASPVTHIVVIPKEEAK